MIKKLTEAQEILTEELKDEDFRKYYEEEGRRLQVGYKIAELRHKLGLTQKQLARKIHTTQSVLSRLENGDYWTCTLSTLEKIALATGRHLMINFKK